MPGRMKHTKNMNGLMRIIKREHHNRNLCAIGNMIKTAANLLGLFARAFWRHADPDLLTLPDNFNNLLGMALRRMANYRHYANPFQQRFYRCIKQGMFAKNSDF